MNTKENGVMFNEDDETTYPPEYTFVVTNLMPSVPVYYDRKFNRWWSPIADPDAVDLYARDDMGDVDELDLYWQPIEFKKTDVLLISAQE